eukprot:216345-Alexandrium_andersonii.AAC.1
MFRPHLSDLRQPSRPCPVPLPHPAPPASSPRSCRLAPSCRRWPPLRGRPKETFDECISALLLPAGGC